MHQQYQQAVNLRDKLESKNEKDRTLAEYKTAANAFRKIFMSTSRIPEAPDSLFAAARLYRQMGRQFEPEYFDTAIVTYRFLLRSYTNSHYRGRGALQHRPDSAAGYGSAGRREGYFSRVFEAISARRACQRCSRRAGPDRRSARCGSSNIGSAGERTGSAGCRSSGYPRAPVHKLTTNRLTREPREARRPAKVRVHRG